MPSLSSPVAAKAKQENHAIAHSEESQQRQRASPPRTCPSLKRAMKSKRMLVLIGIKIIVCMIISLSIGNYHHNQYANEITISMASPSALHSKLQQFLGDGDGEGKPKGNITDEKTKTIGEDTNANHQQKIDDPNHERSAFQSIINRVKWTNGQCNNVPPSQIHTLSKPLKIFTDLPMLPEAGVGPALERWMKDNPYSPATGYPTCYLPPPKSCNVTTYTIIIMSHKTERLPTFMDPVESMIFSWPGLTEVIIVWNSPRDTLTKAASNAQYAAKLLQWDGDASHPLRIFFSLDNGLENNLLNRYHPILKPKNDAVMYFDDDGPFWSKEAMVYIGFELWKRNSNVQVGAFPRNVRFMSARMKGSEKMLLKQSIDIVVEDKDGYEGVTHPKFTPLCRNATGDHAAAVEDAANALLPVCDKKKCHKKSCPPCRNVTGDHVEYNYFSFPDFAGHVLLPSGSLLHRNFLCFIWHPALTELRTWVLAHKTMPDDMTVSTLISHLSGRAPRTFPREISDGRRLTSEEPDQMLVQKEQDIDPDLQSPEPDQSHRRLLWKQPNWGGFREEAINSILGYFGSIHPGSVGWCAGTPHMKDNNRGVPHLCHPEKPTLGLIPWLTEDGIGAKQCPPFNDEIIKEAQSVAKKKTEGEGALFGSLCQDCKYRNTGISCRQRMQYLIDKYNTDPTEAKASVIKEEPNCEKV